MSFPYEDPRKPDPRFPNRPTREDFAELSEAVQANDRESEAGRFKERIGEFVDFDSLEYLVTTRAAMVAQLQGDPSPANVARIAGGLMDGFVLGAAYERGRMTTSLEDVRREERDAERRNEERRNPEQPL